VTKENTPEKSIKKMGFQKERLLSPGFEKEFRDIPFWGLVSIASAFLIFTINVKSYFLAAFLVTVVFLSLVLKWRIRVSRITQIILALVLSAILLFLTGGKVVQTFTMAVRLRYIAYYLTFVLCFLCIISAYKIKSSNELYMSYISTILIVVIASLFSPWHGTSENILLFSLYAFSSLLYFIDLVLLSYPIVKSDRIFSKARALPLIICMIIVVFLSIYVGKFAKKYEPSLLKFLVNRTNVLPSYSFSSISRLGTVESIYQSKKVVMRIFKKRGSVKVTARIYNQYEKGKWSISSLSKRVQPSSPNLPGNIRDKIRQEGGNLFYMPAGKKDPVIDREQLNLEKYYIFFRKNNNLYFPHHSVYAAADKPYLEKDNLGNIHNKQGFLEEYQVITPSDRRKILSPDIPPPDPKDLEVPENLLPEFRNIALEITNKRNSRLSRAFAIEQFFHNNFQYRHGIKLTYRNMDPVKEFLIYRRAAHCEYYASAMTLMLRSIGIPARYKVGFVVHEFNDSGGYYIVREMDAHAWVQIYDPKKGWVEFDPTPSSVLPTDSGLASNDWLDFINMKMHIFYLYLKSGSIKKLFREILSLILPLLKSLYFWIIAGALLLIILLRKKWLLVRSLFKKKRVIPIELPKEKRIRELYSLLAQFDDKMRAIKISRPLNLTLKEYIQFLEKKELDENFLEKCRAFLGLYSLTRYAKETIDDEDLSNLREFLDEIA